MTVRIGFKCFVMFIGMELLERDVGCLSRVDPPLKVFRMLKKMHLKCVKMLLF